MSLDKALPLAELYQSFCAELQRFQEICTKNQNSFNRFENKSNIGFILLLLCGQSHDFGVALKKLMSTGQSSTSSQMTLLRSLLECVIRIKYIELFDQIGLKNLIYTDLNARIDRYKVAEKAWPEMLKVDGKEPNAILLDSEARDKFKSSGCQIIGKIEKLLTEITTKESDIKAKELYSFYRELCPPAHSDLHYLSKKSAENKCAFTSQGSIYECAAAWINSAGHSLDSVMNRLRLANA